jgi:hypothetical protein
MGPRVMVRSEKGPCAMQLQLPVAGVMAPLDPSEKGEPSKRGLCSIGALRYFE